MVSEREYLVGYDYGMAESEVSHGFNPSRNLRCLSRVGSRAREAFVDHGRAREEDALREQSVSVTPAAIPNGCNYWSASGAPHRDTLGGS